MTLIPRELRQLYQQGRLVPFIGAGVSRSVEWQDNGAHRRGLSWTELVNGAATILGYEDPDLLRVRGTDLQILEYFRVKKNGMASLTNWLYSRMTPPDSAIEASTIHSELARLTECKRYYTTNYDNFLERSLRLHGRECQVVAVENDMGQDASECEIVKFHGDFDNPSGMVLSESHYERRLSFSSPMDLRLRSDMLGRAVIFIGYSFRDANVSYLFRLVNEQLQGLPGSLSGRRAYIAVADPSDFEYILFGERNIEVLPLDGRELTSSVANLLAAIRS